MVSKSPQPENQDVGVGTQIQLRRTCQVLNKLVTSVLLRMIDFKSFFKLTYVLAPRIKSATIGFLQQTGG